ncbi:hypothetical protein BJX61DRAFT_529252 [Aspergillus egyptiacus]|nr:hypothetical protein BJX61DRAFT_529252 [Aspergillus egyptiacus]
MSGRWRAMCFTTELQFFPISLASRQPGGPSHLERGYQTPPGTAELHHHRVSLSDAAHSSPDNRYRTASTSMKRSLFLWPIAGNG